jgi:hypothetical protein
MSCDSVKAITRQRVGHYLQAARHPNPDVDGSTCEFRAAVEFGPSCATTVEVASSAGQQRFKDGLRLEVECYVFEVLLLAVDYCAEALRDFAGFDCLGASSLALRILWLASLV